MTALTEFLLARITEDEAPVAGEWHGGDGDPDFMWGPNRIKAECEAKRRIAQEHAELYWFSGGNRGQTATGKCRICADNEAADYDGAPLVGWPCPTLRALALPYVDHPDYRQEWRP